MVVATTTSVVVVGVVVVVVEASFAPIVTMTVPGTPTLAPLVVLWCFDAI
jgi:hypothetical protein